MCRFFCTFLIVYLKFEKQRGKNPSVNSFKKKFGTPQVQKFTKMKMKSQMKRGQVRKLALKIEGDIKECSFFSWLLAMNSSCGQIIFVSISDMEFLENDGNIWTEVYGNTYGCVYLSEKVMFVLLLTQFTRVEFSNII